MTPDTPRVKIRATPREPVQDKTRRDLGTDEELMALVEKIRGFDYDYVTGDELAALVRAVRIVALDTIARHDEAVALQEKLTEKLALAGIAAELADVVGVIRGAQSSAAPAPPRRRWFS